MFDKIKKLQKETEICDKINKKANELIINKKFDGFSKEELYIIANISANQCMINNREVRKKIIEYENEINKCKELINAKNY